MSTLDEAATMAEEKPRSWVKLALLLGVVALLLALSRVLPLKEYTQGLLSALEGFGGWGLVLLAGAYVIACVLFIPGSALTLGAGFLAATLWPANAVLALVMGTLAVSAGSVSGAAAAFVLGRTFMRRWVAKKISGNARFKAVDEAIGKNGLKMVFLLRLSPAFPFNLLNYALGVTKVTLRDYVLASWIGMLPGTLMYVYLGMASAAVVAKAAGESQGSALQSGLLGAGLVATIVLVVMVTKIAKKALSEAVGDTDKAET